MFEQQSGGKPAGGVIQANYFGDIPAGALVIPGTQFPSAQKNAGQEFPGKDDSGIDQTAENEILMAEQAAEGSQ